MCYKVVYLSYNDEDLELRDRSVNILNDFFKQDYDIDQKEGRLIYIASGGSEQKVSQVTEAFQNIIILCQRENNSFAAALEIAAYLRSQNKRASIIDVFAPNAIKEFEEIYKVYQAIELLAKQKAALIGEVSDWLLISDVESQWVKDVLGIDLKRFHWNKLPNYQKKEPSGEFLKYFPQCKPETLQETAKVYSFLEEVVREKELSAISVECFPMVRRDQVTACLPLAVLNAKNIVAACEGDICSMLGMMLIRAVTGEIPWQANVAEIKDQAALFAHCTAPLHLLKTFDITTHFETNCGTAIKGKFKKQKAGVFRIDNKLEKFMLLKGEILNSPDNNFACRTQIEFKTSKEQAKLLKEKSSGNHHLIFPDKYIPLLERMMQVLGITIIV